jgi:threonine dehydrogenase-like Zn-dependent dehydrogenase
MGEVVEVGSGVQNLKVGDRVVVPFPIACGNCNACKARRTRCARTRNPNAYIAEKLLGHSASGSSATRTSRRLRRRQAEYARVPFADVGPLKVSRRG